MSRTKHKSPIALACILLLLGSGACKSSSKPGKGGHRTVSQTSNKAAFKIAEVKGVGGDDRPEVQQKADAEAPKIAELLNGYYSVAFLDKSKWSGGSHPRLADFFTHDAQAQVAPNLGGLALADLAPKLQTVVPSEQKAIKLTFFVEDDQSVPVGVVTTSFQAKGTATAKDTGTVAIAHHATFWLIKEGESYKIYAYSAELKADSQEKSVAFGVPIDGESN